MNHTISYRNPYVTLFTYTENRPKGLKPNQNVLDQ